MGIFRRKGKADKGKKEDLKQQEEPAAPRQPYKPKHAAADAVPKAVTLGAHGQRVSKQSSDYAQGGDRVQNPNGFSGASASLPPYRGMNGGLNVQRNSNAGVFTTDPNAPPLPTPTPVHNNPGQRRFIPINGTGWFGHQKEGRRSTERHLAGNSKSLTATKDKGHGDPHLSSDSGYGSDGYSRAPSEYGFGGQDTAKPGLLQESAAFLPEMSLSDELAREPAWSEASFAGDDVVVTPRAMEERRTTTYFSQLGPVNDARTPRPSRSSKSIHKQARFDDTVETEQQRIEPHIVRRPSRTSPPPQSTCMKQWQRRSGRSHLLCHRRRLCSPVTASRLASVPSISLGMLSQSGTRRLRPIERTIFRSIGQCVSRAPLPPSTITK